MRNAEACAECGDGKRLPVRAGAQPVINGTGKKGDMGKSTGGERRMQRKEKPCRIAAAGDGDEKPGGSLEPEEKSFDGSLDARLRQAGHGEGSAPRQQDSRLCSLVTFAFTALDAPG